MSRLAGAGNRAITDLLAAQRPLQRQSLHSGAAVTDADAQARITGALDPAATVSSGGGVTVRPWGGRAPGAGLGSPTPDQQRERDATLAGLRRAIFADLDRALPELRGMRARYQRQQVPTDQLEGAGEAAVDVVERVYGSYLANAAGPPSRARHQFRGYGAGTAPAARGSANLLDAYDPDDRSNTGVPISAEAVAFWAALNSPAAAVRERRAFNATSGSQEEMWLDQVAVPAIAAARRTDLELWDQFGFAIVGGARRVLTTTLPRAGLSSRADGSGRPSPALRAVQWENYITLIHEYLHLSEHPAHVRARSRSRFGSALNEGVTDLLTEDVYNRTVASARTDQGVIGKVEGWTPTAGTAASTRELPATYPIAYPEEVRQVRGALPTVTLDGFRAAYLMGHVEYVGLEPDGRARSPVATGTGQGLNLPPSVTTMSALVAGSGVSKADIIAANPQVTSWAVLPRRLNVPGWREHIVVADQPAGRGHVETRAQIAAQHQVTVADLDRHNQHVAGWPVLSAGMRILIPPRGFRP